MEADIFTPEELAGIAAAAGTIDERLGGGHIAVLPLDEAERRAAEGRVAAWRQATGGQQAFATRLSLAGIDEDSATALLGRTRLDPSLPLPPWVAAFARTARALRVPSTSRPDAAAEDAGLLPFEDVLRPAVASAWRDLQARAGSRGLARFSPAAVAALQGSLLRRLSGAAAQALFADFTLFRHLARFRPGTLPGSAATSTGRRRYHAFVAAWRSGRDRDFFLANPVAARIIGTTVLAWLESTAELVERLDRDVTALSATFAGGRDLGPVTGLETDLSDPHRGGRRVVVLAFAGVKIVYKPKDLRMDLAWRDLTRWLAARAAPFVPDAPACLPRDGYGWAGHIAQIPALREAAPVLHHRCAGGLLAILHWLRATDVHNENVIAGAAGPVPVDLETLLRPTLASDVALPFGDPATAAAVDTIANSVLATHYLRAATRRAGADAAAHAGFRHVNTDAMIRVRAPVPRLTAGTSTLAEHRDDFVAGFAETYGFLAHHRAALLAPGGPFAGFRDARPRVLLRDTAAYELLARRAAEPGNLRSGVDWSIPFELLERADAGCSGPDRARLRAAERRALAHGDIPLFTTEADATWIETCGGERIASCLAVAPIDDLMTHAASLGPDDLRFQERVLRCVLPHLPQPAGLPAQPHAPQARDFVAEAVRLGDMLAAAAIHAGDSAAWIGFTSLDGEYGELRATGLDLYSGTTGIAVFLAALANVTGEGRFRALAHAALGPVRAIGQAADGGAATARRIGIGGAEGIASVVYGLVRIGRLLDDPVPIAQAHRLARFIDTGLIESDRSYDVMNGAAGAILGLLALHRADGESSVLARAVDCGEHLLRACRRDGRGNIGWRTLSDTGAFLTGFSHGAAGIALALLRLHRATGDARFRNAAADALRYERHVYLPARQNWPDFRLAGDEAAEPPCQWCHGATGIGIARLRCLGSGEDDDIIRGEIDAALNTTLAAPPSGLDHLCCGNFGRLDFLLTAGRLRGRAGLIDTARERAGRIIEHAAIHGGYGGLGTDDALHPGLFVGIAGIGYELLRLARPDALHSLLLWE